MLGFFGQYPAASRGPYLQGFFVRPDEEVFFFVAAFVGDLEEEVDLRRVAVLREDVPDDNANISALVAPFFGAAALISSSTFVPTHAAFFFAAARAFTIAVNFALAASCAALGAFFPPVDFFAFDFFDDV